ncbi:HipA domain-containing protein [Terrimonas alba]|uniref:HipA domain-containing protein n=1 Tax=Terrimonas alba TaxID=3349636 RepID=UPI0035F3B21A
MEKQRCLYCYQPLSDDGTDFHPMCSKKIFGTEAVPVLAYDNEQMQELAKEIVIKSVAVTGVQPKLSLTLEKTPGDPRKSRFTIVGLWGDFILKPPTEEFPHLPENEDLTMHLAELFNIPTAAHSLIRLRSGELAYITKRFDRINGQKLAIEDMCQLTETLTIDKYRSSLEKVGKCIGKYSTRPGLDAITFFEITLFCFLTGNADMHLKNFSLLTTKDNEIVLAPGYDMLCTRIAMPDDKEEIALTLNAKKRKLKRSDFDSLARSLNIPERAVENSYKKFGAKLSEANRWIDISFLPQQLKAAYKDVVVENREKMRL